jgi:dihydrofolate reductase
MIRAIFSCDSFGGIGFRNAKPWNHALEKSWFRTKTSEGTLVMGRTTWESQDRRAPLSTKPQIVITSKILLRSGAVCYNHDWQKKVQDTATRSCTDIWVVGGRQVLEDSRDILEEVHIARIKGKYNTDVGVNMLRFLEGWRLTNVKPGDDMCTFEVWRPWPQRAPKSSSDGGVSH